MVGFFKSLRIILADMLTGVPESVKLVTEFVWRIRWFLLVGWLGWLLFEVVTKVLPYLMWMFILKTVFGGIFSFLSF